MKNLIIVIASIICFSSCTKVVDLNLGNNNDKIVIEGNIINASGPYQVKITKSVKFSESNNFPAITNAFVTIQDNAGQKDTLTYTTNGIYVTHTLQGIQGRTYTLNTIVDGNTYTAQSTMPATVNLDTIMPITITFGTRTQTNVIPIYLDPPAIGNSYRYVLYKNDTIVNGFYVNNDNIENGKYNQRPVQARTAELKTGDKVTIDLQCIDEVAYNYFFALEQISGNGPGGGTTPSNPINNISGGALGLFSAHTSQSKTIIIP